MLHIEWRLLMYILHPGLAVLLRIGALKYASHV